MKTKALTINTGFHDPNLEAIISKKDLDLKELMRKNARHFAKSNRPMAMGDKILAYIGEAKAGYEHLISYIIQYLQPDSHAPNAKTDADRFREKAKTLETEIGEKKAGLDNMENDMGNYSPGSIPVRLFGVGIVTLIFVLGEIAFNTSAFQDWGDSMILAMIYASMISLAILVFAHISAHYYKKQPTRFRQFLSTLCSLIIVSVPIAIMAYARTRHLAGQEIKVSPSDFVGINLFLFIVSLLMSVLALPEWPEIKRYLEQRKIYRNIAKRGKEIKKLKEEKGAIVDIVTDRTQDRILLGNYAITSVDRVKKLYLESVEIFKATNMSCRTDSKTPDCFYEETPELDIKEINFSFTYNNKAS